jgi:lipoyl(octanoyl) transferase
MDGPSNMALDAALLASVQQGGRPAIRLYRWSPACLSFGRNQPARGVYDPDLAQRMAIDFVRRPTGGQAVLHDDELTYAVVAPTTWIGRPRSAYHRINGGLVAGLRALGVAADVAPGLAAGASPPAGLSWTDACFRRPAAGEVVVGGRKLVGSAQRMEGRVILQHGSLLVGGSQAGAEQLLATGGRAGDVVDPGTGWTTLEGELGGRPEWGDLQTALVAGFESVLGTRIAPSGLAAAELEATDRLRLQFASTDWTWRR